MERKNSLSGLVLSLLALVMTAMPTFASEADLVVPNIKTISPDSFNLLVIGIIVSVIGVVFGFIELRNLLFMRQWRM